MGAVPSIAKTIAIRAFCSRHYKRIGSDEFFGGWDDLPAWTKADWLAIATKLANDATPEQVYAQVERLVTDFQRREPGAG